MSASSDRRSLLGTLSLIGIFLLIGAAYVALVSDSWVKNRISAERALNYQVLGDAATMAERRGTAWFQRAFLHSGLVASSYQLVEGPGIDQEATGAAVSGMFDGVADWMGERTEVLWLMLYELCVRLSTCLLWWQYAAIVMIPFVIDAMVARRVKQSSFFHTSPHVFRIARFVIGWSPAVFFFMLFAPTVLSPRVMPLMIVVLAVSIWAGIAQFAKKA
jgi:hypothetical protein